MSDAGSTFVYNILPIGKFSHRGYGEMEITPQLVKEIAGNFGKHPAYPVPVKLGHGDGAPSPGTVKTAEARADGLYITFEVDGETARAIRERNFRYMSAEYDEDYTDRTGARVGGVITGAGLVNQPGHPDVAPFMLSDGGEKENGKEGTGMSELEELKKKNEELQRQLDDKGTAEKMKKLSDELEASKAEARKREEALVAEIAAQKREKRKAEVAALCDGWKKNGVPPVLVDKLMPLMLLEAASVKLSDGKEQSALEIIKAALDVCPRVDMSGISLSDRTYVPAGAGENDYKAGAAAAKQMNEGRN
jgi:hypothetical protein